MGSVFDNLVQAAQNPRASCEEIATLLRVIPEQNHGRIERLLKERGEGFYSEVMNLIKNAPTATA